MAPATWFARLSDTAKGATVLVSLTVTVATASWAAYGFVGAQAGLPRRVHELEAVTQRHTAEIDSIRGNATTLEKKMDRILCYAESQAGVRPVSECIR